MAKIVEANSEGDLDKIKEQIALARSWAWKHFNANNCHETRLVDENLNMLPPSFFVEFPTPDTMRVSPSIMGTSGLWIYYRLHFKRDGRLVWRGKHPLWGTPFHPLNVPRPPKGDNV